MTRYTPIAAGTAVAATVRDPAVRRLYEKAKRLGTWDPGAIDLTRDAEQWSRLGDDERGLLSSVVSMFASGEEAVTRDLLPLAFVVGRQRRLDDELFLTAWLWEEGKHADFFRRYLDEVLGGEPEIAARPKQYERLLLDEELSSAMDRLYEDSSPEAQAQALTTYCLIVEGVLADTGQRVFEEALAKRNLLPGLRTGLELVNRDESRHVAYGLHVLRRLIDADPGIAAVVHGRARELGPLAKALVDAVILGYETRPFGLSDAFQDPVARLLAQLQRLQPAD